MDNLIDESFLTRLGTEFSGMVLAYQRLLLNVGGNSKVQGIVETGLKYNHRYFTENYNMERQLASRYHVICKLIDTPNIHSEAKRELRAFKKRLGAMMGRMSKRCDIKTKLKEMNQNAN